MKIYRVQLIGTPENFNNDESLGYSYFTSKREALKVHRDHPEPREENFQEINVEMSKPGILRALNQYGGHPDNG